MAGRNYHTFRLTDYALRAGRVAPAGPWSAAQMRDAIERVCDQSDISPVSAAFRQVLSKRSGALKDTAKLFWKSLRSVAAAATRRKSSKPWRPLSKRLNRLSAASWHR